MRKSNAWHATREARAAWELRANFEELFEAAIAWRQDGDFLAMEIALDALAYDRERRGFPPLDKAMPRDQRIAALAARYVSISQFTNRMRRIADEVDAARLSIGDEIRLTIAERDEVSEYAQLLLKGVQATGIGQPDLHPPSRARAQVVADAIRDYNAGRRHPRDRIGGESYADLPISEWSSLPRRFAGIELVDVPTEDAGGFEPFPLPLSTDIRTFTPDGDRPQFGINRYRTVEAWSIIMRDWAQRKKQPMPGMQPAVWALLLAHRMQADGSDLKKLGGLELVSPWQKGGIVRIELLSQPEDDVPY